MSAVRAQAQPQQQQLPPCKEGLSGSGLPPLQPAEQLAAPRQQPEQQPQQAAAVNPTGEGPGTAGRAEGTAAPAGAAEANHGGSAPLASGCPAGSGAQAVRSGSAAPPRGLASSGQATAIKAELVEGGRGQPCSVSPLAVSIEPVRVDGADTDALPRAKGADSQQAGGAKPQGGAGGIVGRSSAPDQADASAGGLAVGGSDAAHAVEGLRRALLGPAISPTRCEQHSSAGWRLPAHGPAPGSGAFSLLKQRPLAGRASPLLASAQLAAADTSMADCKASFRPPEVAQPLAAVAAPEAAPAPAAAPALGGRGRGGVAANRAGPTAVGSVPRSSTGVAGGAAKSVPSAARLPGSTAAPPPAASPAARPASATAVQRSLVEPCAGAAGTDGSRRGAIEASEGRTAATPLAGPRAGASAPRRQQAPAAAGADGAGRAMPAQAAGAGVLLADHPEEQQPAATRTPPPQQQQAPRQPPDQGLPAAWQREKLEQQAQVQHLTQQLAHANLKADQYKMGKAANAVTASAASAALKHAEDGARGLRAELAVVADRLEALKGLALQGTSDDLQAAEARIEKEQAARADAEAELRREREAKRKLVAGLKDDVVKQVVAATGRVVNENERMRSELRNAHKELEWWRQQSEHRRNDAPRRGPATWPPVRSGWGHDEGHAHPGGGQDLQQPWTNHGRPPPPPSPWPQPQTPPQEQRQQDDRCGRGQVRSVARSSRGREEPPTCGYIEERHYEERPRKRRASDDDGAGMPHRDGELRQAHPPAADRGRAQEAERARQLARGQEPDRWPQQTGGGGRTVRNCKRQADEGPGEQAAHQPPAKRTGCCGDGRVVRR